MKSSLLVFAFSLLSVVSFAKKDKDCIQVQNPDIAFYKVTYNQYMSQEITNGQYRAFLDDLVAQGRGTEAQLYTPDSLQWQTVLIYNGPMVQYYFRHPAYSNYPVVAITKEGAAAYCAWLTDKLKKNEKLGLANAECLLPTETEWVTASAPFVDNPYPWYGPYPYNEQGEMLCNVRVKPIVLNSQLQAGDHNGDVAITTGPTSYYPNKYGLYNMIGNVAEITSEGYVKGGSWGNTFDECDVTKRQDFTLPSVYVGFRVMLKKDATLVTMRKGGSF